MFIDHARIFVRSGDGGNGMASFRREKYVANGGPNGGDGGKGGDVVFQVDPGLHTLMDFRYRRHYKADRGENGKTSNMFGKVAEPLIVKVPPGTIVRDADTKEVIADLTEYEQTAIIAQGGRGGRGNARFVGSTNQAPDYAEKGEPGKELWVELELKLIADVGLIGYPNVGKSTLISKVSAAKPKIADYHFTTLVPNLGVVRVAEGKSFVLADIPGLIEGAHTGSGLGHEFLRHIERTKMLVHLVDVSGSEGRDPLEDYHTINKELYLYSQKLSTKKQIVAANKVDIPGVDENLAKLSEALKKDNIEVYPISAVTGEGVDRLVHRIQALLTEIEEQAIPDTESEKDATQVRKIQHRIKPKFNIRKENNIYIIEGEKVENLAMMTDFDREDAVRRFQQILRKIGVDDALQKEGAKDGDVVRIGELEFDYKDY